MFGRSKAIKVRLFGKTDVGKTRDHNEDTFLVADLTRKDSTPPAEEREYELGERGLLLVVADGMGGAAAGELASEMATAMIYKQMTTAWHEETEATGQRFAYRLKEAVEAANLEIHNYAKSHPENRGMGTTTTAAGVLGDHLYVTQVGDSRAYLIRGGEAHQLTRDQSLMQRLVEAGELTEEEAAQSERRNIILQALGPDPKIKVDLTHQEIRKGDILVLCSDGLSGQVKKDEIARATSGEESLSMACERLVALANQRGGPDNITVIAARMDGDGLRAAAAAEEVGHQAFPLIDTETSTEPVPVYRGSKTPVPSRQSRGKLTALLIGAVLLAGGGAARWVLFPSQPKADAPAVADSTARTPTTVAMDSGLLALDITADSVGAAVHDYSEQMKRFGSHEISCADLALHLVQVEEQWTTYNLGKRGIAPLDSGRNTRDRVLYAAVDSVDRDFDRSGCARP